MTSATLSGSMPRRPAPALACQQVGGHSAKATINAIIVVAILVATSLLCVWSRTEVIKQGYVLSELAEGIKTQAALQERLRVEAAVLRSPERIESIALDKLGMKFPGPDQIRCVEYEGGKGG